MAKRINREDPYTDPEMLELLAQAEGKGLSPHVLDRAPWLDDHGGDAPWYDALAEIDNARDDKPRDTTKLRALLVSEQELSHAVRYHIADLLERHAIKRKQGKQAARSYDFSETNTRLWLVVDAMKNYNEMSVEDAARAARAQYGFDKLFAVETLVSAFEGRHGGFNRAMKHAKPQGA